METIGLHEIHITTEINDLFKLRLFCLDHKIKPILALSDYGSFPIQPMISKFKNGTSTEVIEKANKIASDMTEYGIKVIRIKVESMIHNKGVPLEKNDLCSPNNYFEFHLKFDINDSREWNTLAKVCQEKGAHLSFNAFKKETIPLVTLRLAGNLGMNQAIALKDALMDHVKQAGFASNSAIQCEFSVYDNNINLDSGWLQTIV